MSTHLNKEGNPIMVDVSDKKVTLRIAKAITKMRFNQKAYTVLKDGYSKKGDITSVATVAGVMAAKNTSTIIPLCHPLHLTNVEISYHYDDDLLELEINSTVKTKGETGVEMEALTSATVTALTIYDMLKSIQKDIVITETKLLSKSGGKSDYESNKS